MSIPIAIKSRRKLNYGYIGILNDGLNITLYWSICALIAFYVYVANTDYVNLSVGTAWIVIILSRIMIVKRKRNYLKQFAPVGICRFKKTNGDYDVLTMAGIEDPNASICVIFGYNDGLTHINMALKFRPFAYDKENHMMYRYEPSRRLFETDEIAIVAAKKAPRWARKILNSAIK